MSDEQCESDSAGEDRKIPGSLFWYLVAWLSFSFGAFLWHLFVPRLAQERSAWGTAPGWQRELALWNLGLEASIIATLIKNEKTLTRRVGTILVLLSFLLGLNHLHAALGVKSKWATIHVLGAALNLLLGVGWGALSVRRAG